MKIFLCDLINIFPKIGQNLILTHWEPVFSSVNFLRQVLPHENFH